MIRTSLCLLAASALLFLAACAGPTPTFEGEDMENVYGIASSTQLNYDNNLHIAAGNFWREEYVDETGVTRSGTTAGLWLSDYADPSQNTHVRVHVGQEILFSRYHIRVVEIGQEGSEASIWLAITVVGTPAP